MPILKVCTTMLVSLVLLLSVPFNQPQQTSCQPSRLASSAVGFPEIKGQSADEELWALIFSNHAPFWAGDQVKIVWRMTGTGDFSLSAQHADGTTLQPLWGPIFHGSSNWTRPGQEWGAGFQFPKAGCWRIVVRRGDASGEVDFLVVEPPEFF